MKSRLVIALIISFVIYMGTSSVNYNLDYNTQELESEIEQYKQKIDEILINERVKLAREEAQKKYGLEFNNNWYYLKEEDE